MFFKPWNKRLRTVLSKAGNKNTEATFVWKTHSIHSRWSVQAIEPKEEHKKVEIIIKMWSLKFHVTAAEEMKFGSSNVLSHECDFACVCAWFWSSRGNESGCLMNFYVFVKHQCVVLNCVTVLSLFEIMTCWILLLSFSKINLGCVSVLYVRIGNLNNTTFLFLHLIHNRIKE